MLKKLQNIAYIDNTNLYKGCESEGFKIDYVKFRKYLAERHAVETAYIFIGFVAGNEDMYKQFQEQGYTLIFKPTIPNDDGIKGNCDAELVLQATIDFFEKKYEKATIITSDGDFACLVKFLLKNGSLDHILSPRLNKRCSSLLKSTKAKITFLPEVKDLIEFK